MELDLEDQRVTVRDAICNFRRHEIRPALQLRRYRFAAPWLPLSQENYQRYQDLEPADRRTELDRLAVAGTLIGLRGFGVKFADRLYAGFEMRSIRPCRYKDVNMLGFNGAPAKMSEGYFRFLCPRCGEMCATVNPRNNLAHCFCCKKNLNNIDLLITLDYDFRSAVALLQRWLNDYEAGQVKSK